MKQLCEAKMSVAVEVMVQIPASGFDDIPPANLYEPLVIATVVPTEPEDTLSTRTGLGSTVNVVVWVRLEDPDGSVVSVTFRVYEPCPALEETEKNAETAPAADIVHSVRLESMSNNAPGPKAYNAQLCEPNAPLNPLPEI
jgi:hypothetical protein